MKFKNCRCDYCKTYNNFPILWKIEDNYWFEIPKNASSTLKKHFFNEVYIRECKRIEQFTITDYYKIRNNKPVVIYREPYERFISLFNHYCLEEGGRFKKRMVPFANSLGVDITNLSIEERLEFLLGNISKLNSIEEVHHFYPQTYFVDQETFVEFTFVAMGDVSTTFGVPVNNKTITSRKVSVTKEQIQKIKNIYQSDYNFLNKHGVI